MTPSPFVWISPGRMFGAPCIGGTRITTATIAGMVRGGDNVDWLAEMYDVTRGDVLVACWYETERHPRAADWATWREWADMGVAHALDRAPDPPAVASDGTVEG